MFRQRTAAAHLFFKTCGAMNVRIPVWCPYAIIRLRSRRPMCHPLLIGDSTSLTEKSEHAFGVPEKKTGVDNKWITAALSEIVEERVLVGNADVAHDGSRNYFRVAGEDVLWIANEKDVRGLIEQGFVQHFNVMRHIFYELDWLVRGFKDGQPYLGLVNRQGLQNLVCTGVGNS